MNHQPLTLDQLPRCCVEAEFDFATTDDLEPLTEIIGQDRAVEAIRFGLGMAHQGYNLFVLGPPGVGKFTAISQYLTEAARRGPVPGDWCYVNNFVDDSKPILLALPPGRGSLLRDDLQRLIDDLKNAIPQAFDSDHYKARVQQIEAEMQGRQERAFAALQEAAARQNIRVYQNAGEITLVPMANGQDLEPEAFQRLPEAQRQQLEAAVVEIRKQLQEIFQRQMPAWRKEAREWFRALNHEVTRDAVGLYMESLSRRYADLPQVLDYLNGVQKDIIAHAELFRPQEGQQLLPLPMADEPLHRYRVNLILDHGQNIGRPVIYEEHPSYANLVGRIEHRAVMGALLTNFTLIKPGALHRANGGYLILDARKLLGQPFAWEALKQALGKRELRIESLEQVLSFAATTSLEPQPMPLEVKIVLLGDRQLYYLLHAYDPDFAELFKVAADFETGLERSPQNDLRYARMIATQVRSRGLAPFDRSAVAAVIQHSMRLEADALKLSTHMRSVADLLVEAHYWAGQNGNATVSAADVRQAIGAQIERLDRVRDRSYEHILRDAVMIDTQGAVVGQVNGLSVLQVGNFSFGQPSRITATTRLGDGRVIDIERETELGGPIHSKGVFILSNFLGARYGQAQPLALTASLTFEQSYGGVEGDSASMAELCALLSSLSQVPIRQCYAMTGSVNQLGRAQVIGGVSEKVEGFFDICKARGLTGEQGVLLPKANVVNLILRPEVLDAIAAGQFRLYAIEDIDQAIEILTGVAAGVPDAEGNYPADSLNGRVQARLRRFAELRRDFGRSDGKEADKPGAHKAEPVPPPSLP
jgi:predicted ATP-dependent protease